VNERGKPETLVASHPGNANAVRHGIFSNRILAPRIEAYRDELLALPHVAPVDVAAVDECARLLARIDAVDCDIDERGHFGRNGARSLLEHRARLSRELRAWLAALGATPAARAEWVSKLTRPSFRDEVERRRQEIEAREAQNGGA
jgi:hypothetical protein